MLPTHGAKRSNGVSIPTTNMNVRYIYTLSIRTANYVGGTFPRVACGILVNYLLLVFALQFEFYSQRIEVHG